METGLTSLKIELINPVFVVIRWNFSQNPLKPVIHDDKHALRRNSSCAMIHISQCVENRNMDIEKNNRSSWRGGWEQKRVFSTYGDICGDIVHIRIWCGGWIMKYANVSQIIFKNKQNIPWNEVEQYLKRYIGNHL